MNHDEQDSLWKLLGRTRPTKARPAFVQNVLRAIRTSEPVRELGFFEWLRQGWNGLAFAGAAAVVLLIAVGSHTSQPAARELATADPVAVEATLQVVNSVDVLLALEDNNAWLDSSRP